MKNALLKGINYPGSTSINPQPPSKLSGSNINILVQWHIKFLKFSASLSASSFLSNKSAVELLFKKNKE